MSIHLSPRGSHETDPFDLYVVKSGNGYLLRFEAGNLLLTTSVKQATRYTKQAAVSRLSTLQNRGFKGEIIPFDNLY